MKQVYYKAIPYVKEEVTLALESGVDGLIVPDAKAVETRKLARCRVIPESSAVFVTLSSKEEEERLASYLRALSPERTEGPAVVALSEGWEIIPVENLLAAASGFGLEVSGRDGAAVAAGVLERGVDTLVVAPEGIGDIKAIVEAFRYTPETLSLRPARITRIAEAGMGHRVCVDTTSLLRSGQGMLVGNSAAFTFLVNAESEHNDYVAARPFRVNAGGVHAYALLPDDRTAYLEELAAGAKVLIADWQGNCRIATVGRVKVERRPLLLIEAECDGENGPIKGAVFLQNAETIRLVGPDGAPVSVVALAVGDNVLCRIDAAGRHFGMRIDEEIVEG